MARTTELEAFEHEVKTTRSILNKLCAIEDRATRERILNRVWAHVFKDAANEPEPELASADPADDVIPIDGAASDFGQAG